MLVNPKNMLEKARAHGHAIPSPDFLDSNSARAFARVAEELQAPLILSFAEVHLNHLDLEEAASLGRFYAQAASVPVALHLDHGVHFDIIEKAIDLGFTSVMIDASKEDLAENIRRTQEVVQLAHAKNVYVEAEIGHVGTEDEHNDHAVSTNIYTEVSAAAELVAETGVDSLAVSIGTAHGAYKGTPVLNFERLAELKAALDIPLVLHGGSGSGDENLTACAQGGIAKVNLYTDFVVAALEATYAQHRANWPDVLETSSAAMQDVLRHYYRVLRCTQQF